METPKAVKAPDTGRDSSFEHWYCHTYPSVLSALVLAVGDTDVAAEAAADAFAKALERWERVGSMDSPTGWTYTVALNLARRRYRRAQIERGLRGQSDIAVVRPDALELWD
ncbi:MAG TPA: sigma factor, partial [Mycobacterium sp.]|nr:sigma factor [Mycobacterium sp.]